MHNLFGYLHLVCIEIFLIYISVCSDAVAGCEECNAVDGTCTKCTSPKVLDANTCIGKKNFDVYSMEKYVQQKINNHLPHIVLAVIVDVMDCFVFSITRLWI